MNVPADEAFQHNDVVGDRHRFASLRFRGETWTFAHLEPFAFRLDPGLGFEVDVVVLFSCHCFTSSFSRDGRHIDDIPDEERYQTDNEERVLSVERYELSKRFLPRLVQELNARHIRIVGTNYLTFEILDGDHNLGTYVLFFEVEKDGRRKRRLVLRVQSGYKVQALSRRQDKAGKVRFHTLVKAAYLGNPIRG